MFDWVGKVEFGSFWLGSGARDGYGVCQGAGERGEIRGAEPDTSGTYMGTLGKADFGPVDKIRWGDLLEGQVSCGKWHGACKKRVVRSALDFGPLGPEPLGIELEKQCIISNRKEDDNSMVTMTFSCPGAHVGNGEDSTYFSRNASN